MRTVGRLSGPLVLLGALSGCLLFPPDPEHADEPDVLATYDCPHRGVVQARFRDDEVDLAVATGWRVLPQQPSGSGAKFSDGTLLLWDRGATALISFGDIAEECRRTGLQQLQ